jgi:hypothetical protein
MIMNVEELKQLLHSKMPEIINSVMALYEKGIAIGMKIGIDRHDVWRSFS